MIVIIAGSQSDKNHVHLIEQHLEEEGYQREVHYLSAHRNTQELLDLIKTKGRCVFITVAGLSNALSGVVAANTKAPVIACPPFACVPEYQIDIHSSLRMPKGIPVMVVVHPQNAAEAAKRIVDSWNQT